MKKLFLISSCLAVCFAANANYLYWQVQDTDYQDLSLEDVAGARIGYVTAGQDAGKVCHYLTVYDSVGGVIDSAGEAPIAESANELVRINFADLPNYQSYSYYIELLNSSGDVVARTVKGDNYEYATYSSLANYSVGTSIANVPQAAVWHGGTFEAVPEPSSMALLALGAGLVGLRRKLRKGKKEKRA